MLHLLLSLDFGTEPVSFDKRNSTDPLEPNGMKAGCDGVTDVVENGQTLSGL